MPSSPTLSASLLATVVDTLSGSQADLSAEDLANLEADYETWIRTLFAKYVTDRRTKKAIPFAFFQRDFWEWAWKIERGERSPTFVPVWSRGAAKSTSLEIAIALWGARDQRRNVWYVSETQGQADQHVANVAALLESSAFGQVYPTISERKLGKYKNSQGWTMSRLRCKSGYTVTAFGLDGGMRGMKVEEARPDMIIFDDIDNITDTLLATKKKIELITKSILPAGSDDVIVVVAQNLMHANSIIARLVDGRADFLQDRIVSGPHPALLNFSYEDGVNGFNGRLSQTIKTGTPTWEGLNLEKCQQKIWTLGISAFRSECQHEIQPPPGGIFSELTWQRIEWRELPEIVRGVVVVDPAVTDTDESDAHGIQADGLGVDGFLYRLYSWEDRTSPQDSITRAIKKCLELGFNKIIFETNQGGDLWELTYDAVWEDLVLRGEIKLQNDGVTLHKPIFQGVKATSEMGSKTHRAQAMLASYQRGEIVHVYGTNATLETALYRFPMKKPFDLTDAAYWAWKDLLGEQAAAGSGLDRELKNRPNSQRLLTELGPYIDQIYPQPKPLLAAAHLKPVRATEERRKVFH